MATPEEEAEIQEIMENGPPTREDVARFAGALARLIQGIEALEPPGIMPATDEMLNRLNQYALADVVYESFGLSTSKEQTVRFACWEFEEAQKRFRFRTNGAHGYNLEDVQPNGNIRMRPEYPPGARFNSVDLDAFRKAHKLAILAVDRMEESTTKTKPSPDFDPFMLAETHEPPDDPDKTYKGWLVDSKRTILVAMNYGESYNTKLYEMVDRHEAYMAKLTPRKAAFWIRNRIQHERAMKKLARLRSREELDA